MYKVTGIRILVDFKSHVSYVKKLVFSCSIYFILGDIFQIKMRSTTEHFALPIHFYILEVDTDLLLKIKRVLKAFFF